MPVEGPCCDRERDRERDREPEPSFTLTQVLSAIRTVNDDWTRRYSDMVALVMRPQQAPRSASTMEYPQPSQSQPESRDDISVDDAVRVLRSVVDDTLATSGIAGGPRMKALADRISRLGEDLMRGRVPFHGGPDNGHDAPLPHRITVAVP